MYDRIHPLKSLRTVPSLALALVALAGCGETAARLPAGAGFGASPQLPAPEQSAVPTVNIAPAKGWPAGMAPTGAAGTASPPSRAGSTIRAGCTCCPTATSWSPRPTLRRSPTT